MCKEQKKVSMADIVEYKTVVGDDVREADRARMSGDGSKKKG